MVIEVKLEHIDKIYHNQQGDVHALHDICLEIKGKGITFIIGASGSGKTTLLRILSLEDKDYQGIIELDGTVETIQQEIVLFEAMSVLDNLKLVSDDLSQIKAWLEQFEMLEFMHQKVKKLSIGQKKRIQIIRSLLVNSDYLLCDEPTAALDHENAQLIMETLNNVARDKVVIIVTHEIALVDQYADRIIEIERGKIIKDEQVHAKSIHQPLAIENKKKTLLKQILFIFQYIKARPMEFLFKTMIAFVVLLTAFVSTSLLSATNQVVVERNRWLHGENIIVTQPKNKNLKNEEGNYTNYDVYDKKTIQLIETDVKEVIGYRYGWDATQYALTGSFSKELTIKELKEVVKEDERVYQETGKIPHSQYNKLKKLLKELEESGAEQHLPQDFKITVDFRNYDGFKDHSFSNAPSKEKHRIGEKNSIEVIPYQLFDHYQISLKLGNNSIKDNDVIISSSLAELLAKEYEISEKDLIGKEIPFNYALEKEMQVTVVGITYEENENENQLYFKAGSLDQWIESVYEMNPDYLKYVFVYFLTDPQYDAKTITQKINQTIEGKESVFAPFSESYLTSEAEYQNPIYFYAFIILLGVGLIIIEIIVNILKQKRMNKEEKLLAHYGYSSEILLIGLLVVSFILAGIIQTLLLPYLCEVLNQLAHTFGFASFVTYNLKEYSIAFMISLILFILIEGIMYGIRTYKRR